MRTKLQIEIKDKEVVFCAMRSVARDSCEPLARADTDSDGVHEICNPDLRLNIREVLYAILRLGRKFVS